MMIINSKQSGLYQPHLILHYTHHMMMIPTTLSAIEPVRHTKLVISATLYSSELTAVIRIYSPSSRLISLAKHLQASLNRTATNTHKIQLTH